MKEKDTLYANQLFFYAVLPVLKTIVEGSSLKKKWKNKNAVHQVACYTLENPNDPKEKEAIHFLIEDGTWSVQRGEYSGTPNSELLFRSREHMNNFFKNKIFPLPKGLLAHFPFLQALLKMSSLLGATKPPKKELDQVLLVQCLFYLLTAGISTLNKLDHPQVKAWTQNSPDRVYLLTLPSYENVCAFIRIKAGKSRSGRGEYKRSLPFFTMSFDSPRSALGILLEIDDMIESTVEGKLVMIGGPEFGAQFGDLMLMIGSLIKP